MNERFAFDLERLGAAGLGRGLVAGADEAGRGCLAGPLVAAAVVLDYARLEADDFECLDALDDSKKLRREVREVLYGEIVSRACQIVVASYAPGTIDRCGLHLCNLDGLSRALSALRPQPALAFVDGFKLNECAARHEAVVGGDHRQSHTRPPHARSRRALSAVGLCRPRGLCDRTASRRHLPARNLRAASPLVQQCGLPAAWARARRRGVEGCWARPAEVRRTSP
jgi:hypothetical protein